MGYFPIWRNTGAAERIDIAVVLDTWAWVEYWRGNDRVREIIEGPDHKITSMMTVVELERPYGGDKERMDLMVAKIRLRSRLVPVDLDIARAGGAVRRSMKEGGIADAIIYATAHLNHAKVLTGDPHFKKLPDVIFVGPA
ncbi:MAG: PIN domain-containing protein [Methanoregula sp.]|nr:MAG: PIN domain-containing protein [Methanoregula sp.]